MCEYISHMCIHFKMEVIVSVCVCAPACAYFANVLLCVHEPAVCSLRLPVWTREMTSLTVITFRPATTLLTIYSRHVRAVAAVCELNTNSLLRGYDVQLRKPSTVGLLRSPWLMQTIYTAEIRMAMPVAAAEGDEAATAETVLFLNSLHCDHMGCPHSFKVMRDIRLRGSILYSDSGGLVRKFVVIFA